MTAQNSNRSSIFKKPAANQKTQTRILNFPFVVESYEPKANPPYIKGYRLDTDEDLKICLRDVDGINKGVHKRPEVKDFAAERKFQDSPGVTPGGVLYVQDALPVAGSQEMMSSRWISVLSHTESEAEVIMCTAHYDAPRLGKDTIQNGVKSPGLPYSRATLMFDFDVECISEKLADAIGYTKPFAVDSVDDLKIKLLQLFEKSRSVGAGIRIKVGDQFDAINLYRKTGVPLETTIEEFIKETFDDDMLTMLDSEDSLLEVIPYCSVFMGKKSASEHYKKILDADTNGVMNTSKVDALRYLNQYDDEKGVARSDQLYGDSVVAIRIVDGDEGPVVFFTAIKPLFMKNESILGLSNTLAYTKTDLFSPETVYFTYPNTSTNDDQNNDNQVETKNEMAPANESMKAKSNGENHEPLKDDSISSTKNERTSTPAPVEAPVEQVHQQQQIANESANDGNEASPPSERARRFRRTVA